jgi:formylglycine-generating enzyme required for sulfatase activity/tRNA A-37 threonylcarbamoyl transferase component Bud32
VASGTVSTAELGPDDPNPDHVEHEVDVDVLSVGATVGRYIVVERLGAGAMGVVYAAYDPKLDRKVALKLLRPVKAGGDEARRTARLEREAQAVAKLSHPNVVGIFDVLVYEGRVVLAMEYLGGGTMRSWMDAKKRPWREIVAMFTEVGKGLAAAHAAGQIHRDFKPDNVLLDAKGVPKVADFGLARVRSTTGARAAVDAEEHSAHAVAQELESSPADLTRTGAITGTPAYMAPEQFLGRAVDARTDEFAFCVALWEAICGERPFAGTTIIALADAVTREKIKPPPKDGDLPAWIRRCLTRGLRADPAQRFPDFDELLAALSHDPVVRLRRIVGIGAALLAVGAVLIAFQRRAERRRIEFDRQVAASLDDGRSALRRASQSRAAASTLRKDALAAFDSNRRPEGEHIWAQLRTAMDGVDSALNVAQGAFGTTLRLDPKNPEASRLLADATYERALVAELDNRVSDANGLVHQFSSIDPSGRLMQRWNDPATVSIVIVPPTAHVRIDHYVDRSDHLVAVESKETPGTAGEVRLAPGSYRLTLSAEGHSSVAYPILAHRGEHISIALTLPGHDEIPRGFVLVPAGRFFIGDADETSRKSFLNAVPLHEVEEEPYLVQVDEVTFADWIEFLSDLPPSEAATHLPNVIDAQNAVHLKRSGDKWSLALTITGFQFSATQSERVVYRTRPAEAATQDWLRMPVVGISPLDMRAYVDWLSTRRWVRGARLCSEREWERAARGADARAFPASMATLDSRDANIDETYGRTPGSYGPDEVGRHPQGQSPFGLNDMAGNVWEAVRNEEATTPTVLRGGGYYHGSLSARATNREPAEETMKSPFLGFRVCADAPKSVKSSWSVSQ